MKVISIVYSSLLVVLSFLHYPYAIFTPFGTGSGGMVFFFEFPHVFLASTLSLCYILLNLDRLNLKDRSVQFGIAAVFIALISGFTHNSSFFNIFELLAIIVIPFACRLVLSEEKARDILLWGMSVLFILNLVYCLIINDKIGIAANQNWLAATLASTMLFFVILVREKLDGGAQKAVLAVVGILLIKTFWATEARALIPGACLAGIIFCYHKFNWKLAVGVAGAGVVAIAVFCLLKKDLVERTVNRDIRGPLTTNTISMVVDSPLLGHGPGNFQKEFPAFATDELKKKEYYTSIVEHPHNEFLHISASAGIAFGLCWLAILLILFARKEEGDRSYLIYAVAILFVLGLADKPLVESPSAVAFGILCGFCIPLTAIREKAEVPHALKFAGVTGAVILVILAVMTLQTKVPAERYFYQAEVYRENFKASGDGQGQVNGNQRQGRQAKGSAYA